jgi:hypothetical protein
VNEVDVVVAVEDGKELFLGPHKESAFQIVRDHLARDLGCEVKVLSPSIY